MSEEKLGIEKLLRFTNAMDDAVELGEEVMADGKIDLADIKSIPKAGTVLPEVFMAAREWKGMLLEFKDLDGDEIKEIIDAALDG